MRLFFSIALIGLSTCLSAQVTITYPYNPDGNADGTITVPDLQDFLGNYGGVFSPSDILVNGETLATVLTNLQNSIDSLSALTGGSAGSVLDMPIGTVLPVTSEVVPEGWMLCDGREVAIENYQELFDFIGTTYGAGDSAFWAQVYFPATTFNIPDLRGRTIIGADNMGGESAGIMSQHPSWLGSSGGTEMHQLTEVEMPSHSHEMLDDVITGSTNFGIYTSTSGGSQVSYGTGQGTQSTGGDLPHNNMQPYLTMNYVIKMKATIDLLGDLQSQIDSLSTVEGSILIYDMQPEIDEWWQCCGSSSPDFLTITIPSGFDKVVMQGTLSPYCQSNLSMCQKVYVSIYGGGLYDETTIIWEGNDLRLMSFGIYQSGSVNKEHIRLIKMNDGWKGSFRME